jgi:hypothetical protein
VTSAASDPVKSAALLVATPRLAAAALGVVIQVSLELWLRAPEAYRLRHVMQSAFERMGRIGDLSL